MKNGITLTEDQRKELVLNILTDAIIFERTATAINLLQRVVNPKGEDWEAESQHSGISNAYDLMGVPSYKTFEDEQKYLPIKCIMRKIFYNTLKDDDNRNNRGKQTVMEIGEAIYEEWESFLNTTQFELSKAS